MDTGSGSLPSRPKGHDVVKTPRSRGCRVCVQRRIKCDQTRPFCKRCIRANRQCPGFDKLKFVDEGPGLRNMYEGSEDEPAASQRPSPSSAASLSPQDPFRSETSFQSQAPASKGNGKGKGKQRSISPIHSDNWHQGVFERAAFVSILAPTAYQEQLLANLIASTQQPFSAPIIRSHSLWLAEVAGKPAHSPPLTWAIRAISISRLARQAGDDTLMETSRRIYGKALIKLNNALQDGEDGLSSDTLSATLLLSFYEIFNCTDRDSWVRHAGGAGRLIQLRGPDRHRTGFGRLVFAACRSSLIMDAFEKRVPCFLAEPAWRKLCWEIHSDLRLSASLGDSYEEYFQELVSYPAYLGRTSGFVQDVDANPTDLEDLRNEGLAHRSNFRSVHTRMGEELVALGLEPTQVVSQCNDGMFPIVYDYPDMHIASLYCCYWAAMCALNISIIALENRMSGLVVSRFQTPLEDAQRAAGFVFPAEMYALSADPNNGLIWKAAKQGADLHSYLAENANHARDICKSAAYMSNTPFLGPLYLLFGMRLAVRMPLRREEKQWVLVRMNEIGMSMGLARVEIERYESQRKTGYGTEWEQ